MDWSYPAGFLGNTPVSYDPNPGSRKKNLESAKSAMAMIHAKTKSTTVQKIQYHPVSLLRPTNGVAIVTDPATGKIKITEFPLKYVTL